MEIPLLLIHFVRTSDITFHWKDSSLSAMIRFELIWRLQKSAFCLVLILTTTVEVSWAGHSESAPWRRPFFSNFPWTSATKPLPVNPAPLIQSRPNRLAPEDVIDSVPTLLKEGGADSKWSPFVHPPILLPSASYPVSSIVDSSEFKNSPSEKSTAPFVRKIFGSRNRGRSSENISHKRPKFRPNHLYPETEKWRKTPKRIEDFPLFSTRDGTVDETGDESRGFETSKTRIKSLQLLRKIKRDWNGREVMGKETGRERMFTGLAKRQGINDHGWLIAYG